jgi:hypothetical protein
MPLVLFPFIGQSGHWWHFKRAIAFVAPLFREHMLHARLFSAVLMAQASRHILMCAKHGNTHGHSRRLSVFSFSQPILSGHVAIQQW